MSDRPTILLTGATDGIGRQTARALAARGVKLIAHGRDADKLAALVAELVAELGASSEDIATVISDLSDLDAIGSMIAQLRRTLHAPLDILINNAGVYTTRRETGAQGFELTLTVDYLAPALLSHLALPLLNTSNARIINVASVAHSRGTIDWDDINLTRSFEPDRAYAQAKLALVTFTCELARRLGPTDPVPVSLHPGIVPTKLLAARGIPARDSLHRSADTTVYLTRLPIAELRGHAGGYFVDARAVAPDARAVDPSAGRRLYEWTCRTLGIDGLLRSSN
jgi:NAD(P)-dependent dehydrogenase (short-subunit alcohol dehydrogenase family)